MENSKKTVPMCIKMISDSMPRTTESKRKVAQYIVDNYERVLQLNVTELAEESKSSPSAIVRLCRDLGYKKYQDFKLSLAQQINHPYSQIAESLERTDDLKKIKQKTFKSNVDAINCTLNVLDDKSFTEAVKLIAKARRLEFYGFGGSSSVVADAAHKFLKIGIKGNAISDNDIQAMSASLLEPGDVVIAVSHSGRNKALLYNLEIAKKAGASIIVLTNHAKSPILKYKDVVLFTESRETAFKSDALSSRIAELTIIDALFVGVAFLNYDKSQANIFKARIATVGKKVAL
jgi:DNA-binding MurR/RpiR family transcriptional regulator